MGGVASHIPQKLERIYKLGGDKRGGLEPPLIGAFVILSKI